MKASKIQAGTRLFCTSEGSGTTRVAIFVNRLPGENGRQPINILRVPDFAGLEGPEDEGIVTLSDRELSRNCRIPAIGELPPKRGEA